MGEREQIYHLSNRSFFLLDILYGLCVCYLLLQVFSFHGFHVYLFTLLISRRNASFLLQGKKVLKIKWPCAVHVNEMHADAGIRCLVILFRRKFYLKRLISVIIYSTDAYVFLYIVIRQGANEYLHEKLMSIYMKNVGPMLQCKVFIGWRWSIWSPGLVVYSFRALTWS